VPLAKPISNTKALGQVLYTDYFFAFQIAAVVLLLAMVAAIALTLRHRKDAKHQDPGQQVRVQAKDRLKMVQFPKAGQSADSETASSKGEGA
jgi:NADH-quinone oxidoreductase subunit J